jgi:23S rRNA-/tRNA-specific pseudouridylate synthase
LASENNNHLTEIDIKTGRTHQIRVHLSSIGMPILGDNKYGGPKYERLMLHSWKLKINLLNGETKLFEAPIPNEFSSLFENIEEIVDKE